MENLVSLLYLSRTSEVFRVEDLPALLARAQERNQRHGLSGALLFYAGRFMQVIEGPEPEVQRCFERIRADVRHACVTAVALQPIVERRFARWGMRRVEMAQGPDRAVAAFLDELTSAPDDARVSAAIGLLERLTRR
jgi:Sensors of blue-light using FAD